MLTIALPKGSLEEQTMLLFAQADLEVKKSSREYNPTISDPRIGKVKILRPQEIPVFVQDGETSTWASRATTGSPRPARMWSR